jgi:hypothetical protein
MLNVPGVSKYRPWRQRIAFIPDDDFLQAIAAGKASVVTDEIERRGRARRGARAPPGRP